MHSSEHRPLVVVYKIDYFVKRSLSSSLVLLNTRVVLLPHSKVLVHNTNCEAMYCLKDLLSLLAVNLSHLDL